MEYLLCALCWASPQRAWETVTSPLVPSFERSGGPESRRAADVQSEPSLADLPSGTGERSPAFRSKHSLLSSCLNKAREAGRRPVVGEEETKVVWDFM